MIDILGLSPSDTLFILSCTQKKIWDLIPTAPEYVPARYVYKGKKFIKFLRWAEDNEIEKQGFSWMILSGKYGLIEPWHPISRHDVNLIDPETGPVSDETLRRQVLQKRSWHHRDGLIETSIIQFYMIICVNCSEKYLERLKPAFLGKELLVVDIESHKI